MDEPIWMFGSVVRAIDLRQLSEHGGLGDVRDEALLSSALAQKNLFAYSEPKPDLAALAASYVYGVVRNHPFIDANKRTGYVLARTFLRINGADIDAAEAEKYVNFFGVAEGSVSELAIANWLRNHLVRPE